jgi:hypothetical protein
VNGAISPKCGTAGTAFSISVWGFTPNEQVGFWLTDPNGLIVGTVETVSIGPEGRLDGLPFGTSGFMPGLYYWVFEGVSSGNQSILYFKIIP